MLPWMHAALHQSFKKNNPDLRIYLTSGILGARIRDVKTVLAQLKAT
jgi:hypothetical protein